MTSINNDLQNVYNMNKVQLQNEIRTYGGKVSGNVSTLCNRVKRLRNHEFIPTDFPYGKIPTNLRKPPSKPSNGKEVFNDDCCICMETITSDGVKTKCNHGFHAKCLNKWLKNDSRCPLCRTHVTKKKKKQAVARTYIESVMGNNSNNHLQVPYVSPSIVQQISRPQLIRSDTQSRQFMNTLLLETALDQQASVLNRINIARNNNLHNQVLTYSLELSDITRRIRRLMQ